MKNLFVLAFVFLLAACDTGGSDSGGMVEPTLPGTNIPANFAGTYTGTLNVTAEALSITESDSFPITVTVTEDGMVRFDGDEPDETFTVGLEDSGNFRGSLDIDEDECSGTIAVTGSVNGTTASGTVEGSGECEISGIKVDVSLSGDFNATK